MQGILVGTDRAQEWLLPWWWERYSRHNDYPVAFADFGMSKEARAWCAERGVVIEVPAPEVSDVHPTASCSCKRTKKLIESGKIEHFRRIWFKKPVALSLSPFQRTVYLDLDCEVRGKLEPLFNLPLPDSKFAAHHDGYQLYREERMPQYNSGVILFERGSLIVKYWIEGIKEGSRIALTEEMLLLIFLHHFQIPLLLLPPEYNWIITRHGPHEQALIYHWLGEEGKEAIRQSIGKNLCKAS